MGFVILAATLKYLSNIDQVLQWNLLTRERFLAGWVVLFALPGLYLLGFLRMEGIKQEEPLGPGPPAHRRVFPDLLDEPDPRDVRRAAGRARRLRAAALRNGAAGPGNAGGRVAWMKNRYREAIEAARAANKPVLVSFTGYACTNCHWMKANMFTRAEVAGALDGFVAAGAVHRRHR